MQSGGRAKSPLFPPPSLQAAAGRLFFKGGDWTPVFTGMTVVLGVFKRGQSPSLSFVSHNYYSVWRGNDIMAN
jgi:hypothetical protein